MSSITPEHLELSRQVTACQVRIETLERSLEDIKKEHKEYVERQEARSYNRSSQYYMAIIGLISGIIGGLITTYVSNVLFSG